MMLAYIAYVGCVVVLAGITYWIGYEAGKRDRDDADCAHCPALESMEELAREMEENEK